MARDAELDRLKAAQEAAFKKKQSAYGVMDRAWQRRSQARDRLNQAYEAKQQAYKVLDAQWQTLQSIRSSNGPRIDLLNAQQEAAYQSMKSAFENASAAHERRDGAMARSYADDGHRYKAASQGYVTERRRLVEEIKSARAQHDAAKPAFEQAKSNYAEAKRNFDLAKAAHEQAQAAFNSAKSESDQATTAFKKRLETVRAKTNRRREEKRSIAEKAGVPYQYRDNVWISTDADGNINIYFGGSGKPNGPGHGHYAMDSSGKVTYLRQPYDQHGAQNFAENRREQATRQMAQMAMNQWAKTQTTPWQTQYEDTEFKVTVKSGYDKDRDTIVTDVLIYDRQNKREHYHLVIDQNGHELFSEWRPNH